MQPEDLGLPPEAGEALHLALGLFSGNLLATINWLKSPAIALAGKVPMDLLQTREGQQQVIELIWKLENGVSI
ncbi:antitoxin Xre/MbcA/ParS toxin-binding domain-containing protein [Pseudomonas putida]